MQSCSMRKKPAEKGDTPEEKEEERGTGWLSNLFSSSSESKYTMTK